MYLMIFEIFQIILRRKRFFFKGYSRYSRSYCLGKEMLNDILEIWIILRRKRNLLFLYILDLPAKERDFIYYILDLFFVYSRSSCGGKKICLCYSRFSRSSCVENLKKMKFYIFQIILRCPGFSYSNKYIRMYDFLKHKQRQYLFWN